MSGKEIYRKLTKEKQRQLWKDFEKQSPNRIKFRIVNIIQCVGIVTFCIWNLIDLINFYSNGFSNLTLHIIPIIGFAVFSIMFIVLGSFRIKSFYKYVLILEQTLLDNETNNVL